MMRRVGAAVAVATLIAVAFGASSQRTTAAVPTVDVNILLDQAPSDAIVADLSRYGAVVDVIRELNAVTLRADIARAAALRTRPHVQVVTEDMGADALPTASQRVGPHDLANGRNTWNMDAVNVTDLGRGRTVGYDGTGTYVAVLDSGLTPGWRSYFPQQAVSVGFARDFTIDRSGKGGPGGSHGWEQDLFGHGTSVTAIIHGYHVDNPIYPAGAQGPKEGTAPGSTIIPVRVVDDAGQVPVSRLVRGLVYVASLKAQELARHPVVAQMAIAYRSDDPLLRQAVDFAIAHGVIPVAAAGNSGTVGLRYPAAYPEVISVGATGATAMWQPGADGVPGNWWRADDVLDPADPQDAFVTDFSTRAAQGEDLDVVAPGLDIFAPAQWDGGYPDHRFLWGTSMSSPHVAGVVALLTQKNPQLTPAQAEAAITDGAASLPAGCRSVLYWIDPPPVTFCWETDATGSGLVNADGALQNTPLS